MLSIKGIVEPLGYDVCISMPAGGIVDVNTIMRNYPLIINGIIMHANLIVIQLREFNVIVGMDWLSKYHT